MENSVFITHVEIKNYKSIANCRVRLDPLTYLVGPNGSGKSNFLDALRFISDALNTTFDHALRDRGGIKDVRRKSNGHPNHFSIHLTFRDRHGGSGTYGFKVGAKPNGGFEIQRESCRLVGFFSEDAFFDVSNGVVTASSLKVPPAASSDRLFLVNASGTSEFRPLYESLSHMGFYSLNPDRIRDLQFLDEGEILRRDGSNLASVIRQLEKRPDLKNRIEEFLSLVVPGVESVEAKSVGPRETIEFRQRIKGLDRPRFLATSMSDGTLRALGILVALFQGRNTSSHFVQLIGIEEPEVALHPAAAGILRDSLNEASLTTQILVTSHSPELLDDEDIDGESIRAVISEDGITRIAELDEASKFAIKEKLYTPGELLRKNQLAPISAADESAKKPNGQSDIEQED